MKQKVKVIESPLALYLDEREKRERTALGMMPALGGGRRTVGGS